MAQLAGAQYFWTLHHHPVMLMGYILVLEAFPPTSAMIESIQRLSGLPDAAFRTLKMHGELDPHHGKEHDAILDALPLQPAHLEMIGFNIVQTCAGLAACLQALEPLALERRGPETSAA